MSEPSIINTIVNFATNQQSEALGTGTNVCRTTVIIKHRDTLGDYRILPEGILVVVYDEAGNSYPAKIDRRGVSTHYNVRCGEISWQLMKSPKPAITREAYDKSGIVRQLSAEDESFSFDKSDGYLLIQANDVKSKEPRKQFAEPLKIFAGYGSNGVANIEAIYLPPPMLLNLRFNQEINKEEEMCNRERIKQQIFAQGKNVTLFIHGFNVPLGKTGRFPTAKELGKIPSYDTLPRSSEQVQTPYLYYGDIIGKAINERLKAQANALKTKDYAELLKGSKGKINGQPVLLSTKKPYETLDSTLHGEDALSWFPSVEYYLNLAASGKLSPSEPFTDWDKYTRILGVTWSGNVSPEWVFFRAEIYANETGRELAKFIQELDKETKINIITHSLGARVALSALNILGDLDGEYDNRVDNLIMLEAAVADNAISENYTREKNPIAMEQFPFAYKAASSIRVMYSQEDGVLGKDGSRSDFDDGISDAMGGTYPLKYSSFAQKNNAIKDNYQYNPTIAKQEKSIPLSRSDAQEYNVQMECMANMMRSDQDIDDICKYYESRSPLNSRVIENDIRRLIEQEIDEINSDWKKELNILRPWSNFRRFPKDADYTQHIIDVLTQIIFKVDWKLSKKELEIRPALGYAGEKFTAPRPEQDIDENLAEKYPVDMFIKAHYDKQFFFHDQSEYFTNHSAIKNLIWEEMIRTEEQRENMRPTRFSQIYTVTYKREIIDRYIKATSKFGRY